MQRKDNHLIGFIWQADFRGKCLITVVSLGRGGGCCECLPENMLVYRGIDECYS